ncbi:MAG: hypothetical protein D6815_05085 [Candidatus Dadabacteria bacterium]|nr:MAG: hypothetical protein D6815_05085 [Candidatus Dadabacteria bacterium]
MARARKKNRPRRAAASQEQQLLLDQLKDVAAAIGVEVREERLARGLGYTVRSGPCRINGREVLFLDSTAPIDERINVIVEFLSERDLDGIWLEPRLRRLLKGTDDPGQVAGTGDSA